jgi:hypothetical protein
VKICRAATRKRRKSAVQPDPSSASASKKPPRFRSMPSVSQRGQAEPMSQVKSGSGNQMLTKKEVRKHFFFEKKKQKTFATLEPP